MASSTNLKELGVLVVVVLKARNLPDKHTFSKQDPFTVIQLGPFKEQTQIDKRGGQHPVWDEELRLKVLSAETKENRTLKVSCYAKESKGDDLIGTGEVDISDTLKTGEFDDWVKLGTDDTYRGEVYLEMTFFSAGPAPLVRRPSKMTPNERLSRPLQTPPRTISQLQGYPYGGSSPPARYQGELGNSAPSSPRPRPSHLAPPRESRSQSPSSRTEAPLPPLPSEIPAALRPAPHRSSASEIAGTSPKSDNVPIPASLRPGAPGARPAAQRHRHQGSVPVSPSYVPPGQAAYTSPLNDHGSVQTTITTSPRNEYLGLPPVSPSHNNQPAYGPSCPGNGNNEYLSHPPVSAPGQPVYQSPHPPASPFGHPHLPHPPQSAPTLPQAPYHHQTQAPHHQSTYPNYQPSVSPTPYPPINPSYDPPPLSAYTPSSPPPATAPAVPVHSAGSLQLSFPEPSIAPPPPSGSPGLGTGSGYGPASYSGIHHHHHHQPPTTTGTALTSTFYPNEAEEERQRRLSTRYGSPMPLPPGASPPPPPPKPANSTSPNTSPSPRLSHATPSPKTTQAPPPIMPTSSSPPPLSPSHQEPVPQSYTHPRQPPSHSHPPSASPNPITESYLENQRLALERLKQEEADAELARRLAAEAEAEAKAEAEARRARVEEEARAIALAQAEEEKEKQRVKERELEEEREREREREREMERQKSLEDADEELARRLAREWNSDVLEEVRRERRDTPGGALNGSRMPGGW